MGATIEYRLSPHVRVKRISPTHLFIWNKYFPSILKINNDTLDYLSKARLKPGILTRLKSAAIKDNLLAYKIIHEGVSDPCKDQFYENMHKAISQIKDSASVFYARDEPYTNLFITVDKCNLTCGYCIKGYPPGADAEYVKRDYQEGTADRIYRIVDSYVKRQRTSGDLPIKISFNGGEAFLRWKFIRDLVLRLSQKYSSNSFQYFANTNFTIMNRDIAEFLQKHNFALSISIDGYPEAHDRTRRYMNGKGSFGNILRAVKLYNSIARNKIRSFQGTIEYADAFNPEDVFKMSQYGFEECRLAPNLLQTTEEDAKKKADIMLQLIRLSMSQGAFKVTDSYFQNMEKLLNMKSYNYFFNCLGLAAYPSMGINVNMDRMTFSQLCSFVKRAQVAADDVHDDIYHPSLWERTMAFIEERALVLYQQCGDCDLVAICRGSCILMGLDNKNEMNKAACQYQRIMWDGFLEIISDFHLLDKDAVQGPVG